MTLELEIGPRLYNMLTLGFYTFIIYAFFDFVKFLALNVKIPFPWRERPEYVE